MVSWAYDKIGFEKQSISYTIMTDDNSESAKSTKTVLLLDPSISMQEKPSILTGFSVFISKVDGVEILSLILGVIIVIGLGMYYIILVNGVDILKYIPNISFKTIKKSSEEKQKTFQKTQEKTKQTQVQVEGTVQQPVVFNENKKQYDFSYLFKSDNVLRTVPEQYFHVKNGDVVRSITELKEVVEHMDGFTFYYHVNSKNNDFADWVQSVYNEKKLSLLIRNQKTKDDLIKILEKISK